MVTRNLNLIRSHRGEFTTEKLQQLGFREHPFHVSADPRFLYLSKQHLAVLDRAQDVINWREGLAVVEGQIGVGKTTLARRLHEMFAYEAGYDTVYIHTAEYNTPVDAARESVNRARRGHTVPSRDLHAEGSSGAHPTTVFHKS